MLRRAGYLVIPTSSLEPPRSRTTLTRLFTTGGESRRLGSATRARAATPAPA